MAYVSERDLPPLALYQCHKKVHGTFMRRGDYVRLTGQIPREPYEEGQEGYLVIYAKGEPEQYVSWSPRKAFEDGYAKVEE